MRVAELTSYPVKSMGPEPLEAALVEERGLVGDRGWAAYTDDGGIGTGKTTRRFRRVPGLLDVPARTAPDGMPELDLDGWRRVDEPATARRLSDRVGQPLALRAETDVSHHDECPVHVVTTASVDALRERYADRLDAGRFRANLVLDVEGSGFVEDDWTGRALQLGEVVLRIGPGMPRCVMVDLGHGAAGLPEAPGLLRRLGQANDVELGVQATVVRGGTVRCGDEVRVV